MLVMLRRPFLGSTWLLPSSPCSWFSSPASDSRHSLPSTPWPRARMSPPGRLCPATTSPFWKCCCYSDARTRRASTRRSRGTFANTAQGPGPEERCMPPGHGRGPAAIRSRPTQQATQGNRRRGQDTSARLARTRQGETLHVRRSKGAPCSPLAHPPGLRRIGAGPRVERRRPACGNPSRRRLWLEGGGRRPRILLQASTPVASGPAGGDGWQRILGMPLRSGTGLDRSSFRHRSDGSRARAPQSTNDSEPP